MVLRTAYPKDIAVLHESLKNSFASIKQDMDEIKAEIRSSQTAQTATAKELRDELESIKQQFVSADKFNVVKIRLAELSDQLRKVDKLEKTSQEIHQELEGKWKTLASLATSVDDLKSELSAVDKTAKAAVTENEMTKLVEEVNKEFDAMKEDISSIEGKGGKVADLRISRFKEEVESRLEELQARVQRLQEASAEQVKRSSVETLITDINAEFDQAKKSIEDAHDAMKDMKTELQELRREAATKEDVGEELKQMRKALTAVRADVRNTMPRSMVFQDDEKPRAVLKEALAKLSRRKEKVVVMDDTPPKRNRLLLASTLIIILSFFGLGVSVVVFFLDVDYLMNYLIIASIIVFVLGIMLRVAALLKTDAEE